jgi:hypothetical protein
LTDKSVSAGPAVSFNRANKPHFRNSLRGWNHQHVAGFVVSVVLYPMQLPCIVPALYRQLLISTPCSAVFVCCRKPRPANLDVFTKQLLHRDLSVYEERKAQQTSKRSPTAVRSWWGGVRREGNCPGVPVCRGWEGLPALVVLRHNLTTRRPGVC